MLSPELSTGSSAGMWRERLVSQESFRHRAEAAPMQRARPMFAQCAEMRGCRIALVAVPLILRMRLGMGEHDRIARMLGDDRGGGDRQADRITPDDRRCGEAPSGEAVAIDQH